MLIHDKFYYVENSNYEKFCNLVEKLTKRQCVEFVLYCAKDVFHLVEEKSKKFHKPCIDLVEKWLIDENSVTIDELTNAAVDASGAAANAAWIAADAVYYNMWQFTTDLTWLDTAVNCMIWSIHYAACNDKKSNEYLIVANSYLTKTTINCPNYEIEGKILYLIDELDENIIVHKNKYYVNMNGIEKCPEYGFDTQQELLEKLLYSKDQFWEFARSWLDNLYKNQQA